LKKNATGELEGVVATRALHRTGARARVTNITVRICCGSPGGTRVAQAWAGAGAGTTFLRPARFLDRGRRFPTVSHVVCCGRGGRGDREILRGNGRGRLFYRADADRRGCPRDRISDRRLVG